MGAVGFGEGVLVEAYPFAGGHLGNDARGIEFYLVVVGFAYLVGVREIGAVTAAGFVGGAGVEFELADGGHHEEVAQVGVAGAAEMGVAKAADGMVVVLVAGAVFVNVGVVVAVEVVAGGIGLGAELHHAKGDRCAGEHMAHALGADDGVDVLGEVLCLYGGC